MRNHRFRKLISLNAYYLEGVRLFGNNPLDWRYICPVCGHIASAQDFINIGATTDRIGIACIGAIKNPKQAFNPAYGTGKGPCNYSGRGKFDFNPLHVQDLGHYQDFAPRE